MSNHPRRLLTLLAGLSACACVKAASVSISNGTILGLANHSTGVEKFLGIPYAQPPIREFRLRQAQPLQESFGTLNASTFGASCYSSRDQGIESEDCLTLNIWRPIGTGDEALPVLVWLYGGSLTAGYTGDPRFESTAMTRISKDIGKPIVLVSINYRVGPFGFLNGKEMAELGLLNIGMLDQRFALQWLQDNIGAFGGDPAKVTLFGQSAGAVSIYSQMMAYGGRQDGLFRGAVLQSGGAFPLTAPNTPAFQSAFDSLITNTTCKSFANDKASAKLECIRSLPVDIFRASVGSSTGQVVDGDFTRTSIQRALPEGSYIKIPTIVGSNTDEGTTSAPTGIDTTDELFDPVARGFFRPQKLPNDVVSSLIDMYPENPHLGCPYNTGTTMFSPGKLDKKACSIFGDIVQIAPARMIAQSLAKDGVSVYRYRFNHFNNETEEPERGIGTGEELPYVFSNKVPAHAWDKSLAYQMSATWISFAHDLDPSSGTGDAGLPVWPQYGPEADTMVFSGYGSTIQPDTERSDGIQYIIDNILLDGVA